MRFIYLDECKDTEHTKIISLTGLVIDSDKYQLLRKKFYETLSCYIQPEPKTINMSPPEIHGSELLPEITDDEEKLRVLRELVDAIVDVKARVYRVGYYATQSLLNSFGGVDGVLGLCLLGIKIQCQAEYANNMLMPVMDSVNEPVFKVFSGSIRSLDIMRSANINESNMSLKNTENLCEMHFVDSAHSALIQIADITSYLLHAADFELCELNRTDFKNKLISVGSIPRSLLRKFFVQTHKRLNWQCNTPLRVAKSSAAR